MNYAELTRSELYERLRDVQAAIDRIEEKMALYGNCPPSIISSLRSLRGHRSQYEQALDKASVAVEECGNKAVMSGPERLPK